MLCPLVMLFDAKQIEVVNDALADLSKRVNVKLGELPWLSVDDAVRADDGATLDS